MSDKKFKFRVSPVEFEVLNSAMRTITQEMGITMERTSRSPIYYSAHDFSTAILDKDGNLICLTENIPIQSVAAPFIVRAVRKHLGDNIQQGDVMLCNDPYTYDGGNHLSDWSMLIPVFHNNEHIFWTTNRAHMADTGGPVPGGYNPEAKEIFAEGIRIPPIKIYEAGKLRKDVFDFVLANVRFMTAQRGDLWSMLGSIKIGEKRLQGVLDRYGVAIVKNFMLDLQGYTEALMRDEIEKIPDGTYYGEAISDSVPGEPAFIRCKAIINGSNLAIDLSESDAMVPDFHNSTLANTFSSVFIGVMTSIGKNIPYRAEGCLKPIEVITRPGTICHATFPAPIGHCTNFIAKQIIESVWDAMAKVIPEKTPAGWGAVNGLGVKATDPRTNEPFSFQNFNACASGSGAIWGEDGWHAGAPQVCSGGLHYHEIEVAELKYPIFWNKWELATDSAGPGKWRGGAGVDLRWVHEGLPGVSPQMADEFEHGARPCIAGGKPGRLNQCYILRTDGSKEKAQDPILYKIRTNDAQISCCAGGCGVGDPFERDIEKVREDVINEIVSVSSARDDYGVIIDPKTFEIDQSATQKLRGKTK